MGSGLRRKAQAYGTFMGGSNAQPFPFGDIVQLFFQKDVEQTYRQ
jgi:hypothetical protein